MCVALLNPPQELGLHGLADHPTHTHTTPFHQQFGVFLSVMIIGAALFYIYRFYRRNYWGNQGGAADTGAGQGGSGGGRRQANVRTAGGRGGQPLLQEEDWL